MPWGKNALKLFTNQNIQKVFFKWAKPGLFFIYFWSFQANYTNFTTIDVKKCHDHIRCRDLNPQPLKNESSPITTRPGLPPKI